MPQGDFIWCELMTSDAKAAEGFYRDVVGWTADETGVAGIPYTTFKAAGAPVAGLMELSAEMRDAGASPGWLGYVYAGDVDATARRVTELGGVIHRAAEDIPQIGRFAVVGAPDGAVFALFKPSDGGDGPPRGRMVPGHVGWHELMAGELESAFAFYAELFGWVRTEAIDMGPMGIYQLFAARDGEEAIGGMMTRLPEMPASFWLYYFNVEALDAALERVTAGGGTLINEPMEVPGGAWVGQCLDPQGAMFALVALRR
ncbi:VOC family protein [Aurantimonas aggregata]|uniref:VOC family protein n=1 Tax=Aurantimonas aggregata TaxID=2047720 RepID=A0A6L9MEP6_9HYPH|nr:VOC family protein [Aurantimonas aggregata]NDV86353.1 VOC family protein [Aurantimonas aggregata]